MRKMPTLSPFALAFRPFFLGSAIYAMLGMGTWAVVFQGQQVAGVTDFGPPHWWHAHGMIFGYSIGVVAGFLLTAIRNWTGLPTLNGRPLAALFALWAAARVMPHMGAPIEATAAVDLTFNLGLLISVTAPLVQARRWKDVATFPQKLLLLMAANAMVYFGAMGHGPGQRIGLYLGLYVVLAVVLTIGGRVFPFFIRRGLGIDEALQTSRSLVYVNLVALGAFMLVDLIWPSSVGAAALSAAVALINGRRLWTWTRRGVWSQPLLWVLILGYGWLIVGFALLSLDALGVFPAAQGLHALTTGCIGMTTVGMMARVSLGHTGRDIYAPRPVLFVCFGLLMVAATVRVWLPLTGVSYSVVIISSQVAWVAAFALFIGMYAPFLLTPRVDGKPG